jgi:hypothetical protein
MHFIVHVPRTCASPLCLREHLHAGGETNALPCLLAVASKLKAYRKPQSSTKIYALVSCCGQEQRGSSVVAYGHK